MKLRDELVRHDQGDQIGRVFACLAIVFFGKLF
jgi:hypothetical protein